MAAKQSLPDVRRLAWVAALVAACATSCCLDSTPPFVTSTQRETPMDRAQIEERSKLVLPEAASDIKVHSEAGIDTAIWLRFEVPEAAVDELVEHAGFETEFVSDRPVLHDFTGPSISWWKPDEIRKFQGLKDVREGKYARHLHMSSEGPTRTVYYFGTSL